MSDPGGMYDRTGDAINFTTNGPRVRIDFEDRSGKALAMELDADGQEEFAQLYVAACHQAKVNAAQAVSS